MKRDYTAWICQDCGKQLEGITPTGDLTSIKGECPVCKTMETLHPVELYKKVRNCEQA